MTDPAPGTVEWFDRDLNQAWDAWLSENNLCDVLVHPMVRKAFIAGWNAAPATYVVRPEAPSKLHP